MNEISDPLEKKECQDTSEENAKISLIDELKNKRFGRLVVLNSEYKRTKAKKLKLYCECNCDCGRKKLIRYDALKYEKTKSCGCIYIEKLTDDYSPFRWSLQNCMKRLEKKYGKSQKKCDLDLRYLKEIWEKQEGICPYSGIKMHLHPSSSPKHRLNGVSPYQISLDRINSNGDYIKGNVQFVCLFINYAKHSFEHLEVLKFIEQLRINEIPYLK